NVFSLPHDLVLTTDGRPRLAKWSFVPKGSTILTDPADYFAFAATQYQCDRTSIKSKWTQPILRSVDTVHALGALSTREQIRALFTAVLDGLKEQGITLPNSGEEFEKFRAIANAVLKAESMTPQKTEEFERFDNAMEQLLKVPHNEIKKKLDAEKA